MPKTWKNGRLPRMTSSGPKSRTPCSPSRLAMRLRVGERHHLRRALAAAREENHRGVVGARGVERAADAVGRLARAQRARELGHGRDRGGDVLDEDHAVHLRALDLLEELARRDDGPEVQPALGELAVLGRAGGIVDHDRHAAGHEGGDDGQGGAGGVRDHHADKARPVRFELARENQGAQEGRLVGDALAGGAVDDRELVASLLRDAYEGFDESHGGSGVHAACRIRPAVPGAVTPVYAASFAASGGS